MTVLAWIEKWYAAQCDGDWEHAKGVSITTIDNPGWLVTIDLAGTDLEAAADDSLLAATGDPPSAANGNVGGSEWMFCELRAGHFKGAGDPLKLASILEQFRSWAIQNGAQ